MVSRSQQNSKTEGQIAFYFDKKNQPAQKTVLSGFVHSYDPKNPNSVKGEIKLAYPKVGKDLVITFATQCSPSQYKLDSVIDVFAKPNQKIVVATSGHFTKELVEASFSAKSAGLNIELSSNAKANIDYNKPSFKYVGNCNHAVDKLKGSNSLTISVDQDRTNINAKILDKEFLSFSSWAHAEGDYYTNDAVLSFYGLKPIASRFQLKDNGILVSVGAKEGDKLVLTSSLDVAKAGEVRAELQKKGKAIELAHGKVLLDEANFLKSSYGMDSDKIKENVVIPARENIQKTFEAEKAMNKEIAERAVANAKYIENALKKNSPNVKPTVQYYSEEVGKIKNEFFSDKTLQDAFQSV